MTIALGTLEDLPADYRKSMEEVHVSPLWPALRNLLPLDRPIPVTKSSLWSFGRIRPLVLRAGELTPIEKAERRVLVLCDPGRGTAFPQATATIYVGFQLLLPGEHAPAHRHIPSAARIIVEGEGAYTTVNGEKCVMHPGDLILTPGGMWHEHGHEGTEPVIWLDALDVPILAYLEGSYREEGKPQIVPSRPDGSAVEYSQAGLVPSRRYRALRPNYPLLRYPWERTEAGLRAIAKHASSSEIAELEYINPETGDSCLPTLGFTAMMLLPGRVARPPIRSSSAVFHVIHGSGRSTVDGEILAWKSGDTFSVSVFAEVEHSASGTEPAFLIRIHDAPLQQKLGFYEERPRS